MSKRLLTVVIVLLALVPAGCTDDANHTASPDDRIPHGWAIISQGDGNDDTSKISIVDPDSYRIRRTLTAQAFRGTISSRRQFSKDLSRLSYVHDCTVVYAELHGNEYRAVQTWKLPVRPGGDRACFSATWMTDKGELWAMSSVGDDPTRLYTLDPNRSRSEPHDEGAVRSHSDIRLELDRYGDRGSTKVARIAGAPDQSYTGTVTVSDRVLMAASIIAGQARNAGSASYGYRCVEQITDAMLLCVLQPPVDQFSEAPYGSVATATFHRDTATVELKQVIPFDKKGVDYAWASSDRSRVLLFAENRIDMSSENGWYSVKLQPDGSAGGSPVRLSLNLPVAGSFLFWY